MSSAFKILMVFVILGSVSCQDDDKVKMGKAKVTFANSTTLALNQIADLPAGATGSVVVENTRLALYPASSFGTKLVQIYLVQNVGPNGFDNVGGTNSIWINPGCETMTDGPGGAIFMGNGGVCDTSKITDYFEFARPSAEVNADLNSLSNPVQPATYNYIRMQVCDDKSSNDNVQFASVGSGLNEKAQVRTEGCQLTPFKIDPPLVIAPDESFELSLSYDLQKVLIDRHYNVDTGMFQVPDSSNMSRWCVMTDDDKSTRCFYEIDFIPSVTKK